MNSPLPLLFVLSFPQQKGSFLQPLQPVGILLWSSSVTVWLINTICQHRSVKSLPCCMTLTSLFPPCQSPAFSTLPCLQASKSLTASAVPKHFSLCVSFAQCHPAPPAFPWGGALAGGHTPLRATGGSEGKEIIPEDSQAAPHPLGTKDVSGFLWLKSA